MAVGLKERRVCIDCGSYFDARRRNGARPRRCLPCAETWCRTQAGARTVTLADAHAVKALLPEKMSAAAVAKALGIPLRTLRNFEDQALRRWIGGMRREGR
jgi:hypothetical protein